MTEVGKRQRASPREGGAAAGRVDGRSVGADGDSIGYQRSPAQPRGPAKGTGQPSTAAIIASSREKSAEG